MSVPTLLRIATRRSPACRHLSTSIATQRSQSCRPCGALIAQERRQPFSASTTRKSGSDGHHEETFEEFTARYEKEFDGVQDVFELQRNLNNAFAYDLVPSTSVVTAALRAARRVNDFPTAVRVFEAIKVKVENRGQYHEYLRELEPLREELGIDLKEDLYPEQRYTGGANRR